MTSSSPQPNNDDLVCGLIFEKLGSKPVYEFDLMRTLKKNGYQPEDIERCLSLMAKNGTIEKYRSSHGVIWQLSSELQSPEYKELPEHNAVSFDESVNDLCDKMSSNSLTSINGAEGGTSTLPKESRVLPPPATRVRGGNSIRSEQTLPKTASASATENSLDSTSLSSSASILPSTRSYVSELDTRLQPRDDTVSTTPQSSSLEISVPESGQVNQHQETQVDKLLETAVEDIRKVIRIFEDPSKKDLKPRVIAQLGKFGSSRKAANKLLYHLEKKGILTVKTDENNTDPRWNINPEAKFTEKDILEWAAEYVHKSSGCPVSKIEHHHHHLQQNFLQVGNRNVIQINKTTDSRDKES